MPNRHWNEGMSRLGAGFIGAWALFAAPAGAAVDERQQQLSEWRVACATGDGAACYALGEVVCHRNSGPMNLLVSALKEELRHGEKSQTGRDHCEAA